MPHYKNNNYINYNKNYKHNNKNTFNRNTRWKFQKFQPFQKNKVTSYNKKKYSLKNQIFFFRKKVSKKRINKQRRLIFKVKRIRKRLGLVKINRFIVFFSNIKFFRKTPRFNSVNVKNVKVIHKKKVVKKKIIKKKLYTFKFKELEDSWLWGRTTERGKSYWMPKKNENEKPRWLKKKKIRYFSFWSRSIFLDKKEKFETVAFSWSQWLLSSTKSIFNKPAFYKYNFHYYVHVPGRYVFTINNKWTPFYLAIANIKYWWKKKRKIIYYYAPLTNKLVFFNNLITNSKSEIINGNRKFDYTWIEKEDINPKYDFIFFEKLRNYTNSIKKRGPNPFFFYRLIYRNSYIKTVYQKNVQSTRVPWGNRWKFRNYYLRYVKRNHKKKFFFYENKKNFDFPSRVTKYFLNKKKLNHLKFNLIKKTHRFGTSFFQKNLFFLYFLKFKIVSNENKKKEDLQDRKMIPFIFRHTQDNPWRYYKLSRWDCKANPWLNTVMYNRKLFIYHVLHCVTQEKRHPSRYKRFKIYKWFMRSMNNKWNFGIRAKKNYRLRQIMFERIVLPSLDYLKRKQFLFIKKNVSHVKTLGLQNSRSGMFLGKFERRIDVLTYKLNFAPTIQWARNFVKSGLVYVSYLTCTKTRDYRFILNKNQKFPLLNSWKENTINYFNNNIDYFVNKRKTTYLGHQFFNMPLPVTLPAQLVQVTGIVHWNSVNTKTLFYKKLFKRHLPRYFLYNKHQTIAYFWRNLRVIDIDRVKFDRIRKNTMKWLL